MINVKIGLDGKPILEGSDAKIVKLNLSNKYENLDETIVFDLPEEFNDYRKYLLAFITVDDKQYFSPLPIINNSVKVSSSLTQFAGLWTMYVTCRQQELDLTTENVDISPKEGEHVFISDAIYGIVSNSAINKELVKNTPMDSNLKLVYDDLFDLKKQIETKLANGEFKGEKGDPYTESDEFKQLSEQVHQDATNASEAATHASESAKSASSASSEAQKSAQASAGNASSAQDSATNASQSAEKAKASLDDAKKSATSASTSASNAKESSTQASTSASNARKALNDINTYGTQFKQDLATEKQSFTADMEQIKSDTSILREEAGTSATNAKASETNVSKIAEGLQGSLDAISQNAKDVSELKEGITASKEAISELNDKKITKFYASNQGETHIVDSDKGLMQDMVVYGMSSQVKTTGKNLLKIKDATQTTRGITVTSKDGIITVKGTATETGWAYIDVDSQTFTDGTYIISLTSNNNNKAKLVLANSSFKQVMEQNVAVALTNTEISKVCFTVEKDKVYNITEAKVQLEKGSSATSFEPYTGGKPSPSPEYPQEIKSVVNPKIRVVRKNVFKALIEGNAPSTRMGITATIQNNQINLKGTFKDTYAYWELDKTVIKKGTKVNIYISNDNNHGYFVWFREVTTGAIHTINKNTKSMILNADCYISQFGIEYYTVGDTIDLTTTFAILTDTDQYQPYTEQSITLPYTLNAIPVNNNGNVTINGQQYISDYIDVERGKLIKRINVIKLTEFDFNRGTTPNNKCDSFETLLINYSSMNGEACICELFEYHGISYDQAVETSRIFTWNNTMCIQFNSKEGISSIEKFKNLLNQHPNTHCYYVLKEPQEIDLTSEQIQALKELTANYPVTNLFLTSDQLDGYAEFNYPISLANGWNYVKKQINDNRDYIYDMNLDMAEAYVNSEYAVALAELNEELED